MSVRDSTRSRTYAAEEAAFAHTLYHERLGMHGATRLARMLAAEPWWMKLGIDFEVVATRRESTRSFARYGGEDAPDQIRLSIGGENAATLAHECAHLVVINHSPGVAAHGPEFRTALLDVATVLLGTTGREMLADAFAQDRLSVGPRQWDRPEPGTDHGLYGQYRIEVQIEAIRAAGESASPRLTGGAIPLGVVAGD